MRFIPSIHAALLLAAVLLAGPPDPARAVDFRPVLYVNNGAITGYELDQRIRFLQILGTDGDLRQMAIDALIDDRLRLQAGERFGFDVGDRQIAAGMAEFAGRANLETEQFIAAIGEAGVAPETFRDFVRAGLVWREMVRARFSGQVAIPDAGAERAQAIEAGRGLPPRVLLSELVLPREPGETPEELVERASALAARARGETAFAAAAQRLSAADTAAEGGRLDWRPLTDLPGPVRGAVAGLQPGQVSAPVVSGDRAAIYLLRAARAAAEVAPEGVHVEYGEFRLAAAEDAARIAARADRCGDLYADRGAAAGRYPCGAGRAGCRRDGGDRARRRAGHGDAVRAPRRRPVGRAGDQGDARPAGQRTAGRRGRTVAGRTARHRDPARALRRR